MILGQVPHGLVRDAGSGARVPLPSAALVCVAWQDQGGVSWHIAPTIALISFRRDPDSKGLAGQATNRTGTDLWSGPPRRRPPTDCRHLGVEHSVIMASHHGSRAPVLPLSDTLRRPGEVMVP